MLKVKTSIRWRIFYK